MLGNDVVDLSFASRQSNWRRKNYLSKIFSVDEQVLINQAKNADLAVWLMWSMKEAAYKIVNRVTGKRFYNPLAFECEFEITGTVAQGEVHYKSDHYICQTIFADGFLHTFALPGGGNFENVNFVELPNTPNYVKEFNKNYHPWYLHKDENGLPQLLNSHTTSSHVSSISHHGDKLFVTYLSAH